MSLKPFHTSNWARFFSSPICHAFIQRMYEGRRTWRPHKAVRPPPSFNKSWIKAASCGIVGPALWHTWGSRERTSRRATTRKPRPPIRISSPFGKTPTPTSPSWKKPRPSIRNCGSHAANRSSRFATSPTPSTTSMNLGFANCPKTGKSSAILLLDNCFILC